MPKEIVTAIASSNKYTLLNLKLFIFYLFFSLPNKMSHPTLLKTWGCSLHKIKGSITLFGFFIECHLVHLLPFLIDSLSTDRFQLRQYLLLRLY